MTDLKRRKVIAGVTGAAVGAAMSGSLPLSMLAQITEAPSDQETKFAKLSAALTGFNFNLLLPGVDTSQLNHEIFMKVTEKPERTSTLQEMFQIFPDPGTPVQQQTAVASIVSTWDRKDPKQVARCFLGRSIILAWYLGAWYDPKDLETKTYHKPEADYAYRRYSKSVLIPHSVLSPSAYTSGLIWRVMQAHPMGYSNLQFGYWGENPPDLKLFTDQIPVP